MAASPPPLSSFASLLLGILASVISLPPPPFSSRLLDPPAAPHPHAGALPCCVSHPCRMLAPASQRQAPLLFLSSPLLKSAITASRRLVANPQPKTRRAEQLLLSSLLISLLFSLHTLLKVAFFPLVGLINNSFCRYGKLRSNLFSWGSLLGPKIAFTQCTCMYFPGPDML